MQCIQDFRFLKCSRSVSVCVCIVNECESNFHKCNSKNTKTEFNEEKREYFCVVYTCCAGINIVNILQYISFYICNVFFMHFYWQHMLFLSVCARCRASSSCKIASHKYQIKLLRYILWLWNDRFHFSMLNETNNGTHKQRARILIKRLEKTMLISEPSKAEWSFRFYLTVLLVFFIDWN